MLDQINANIFVYLILIPIYFLRCVLDHMLQWFVHLQIKLYFYCFYGRCGRFESDTKKRTFFSEKGSQKR